MAGLTDQMVTVPCGHGSYAIHVQEITILDNCIANVRRIKLNSRS